MGFSINDSLARSREESASTSKQIHEVSDWRDAAVSSAGMSGQLTLAVIDAANSALIDAVPLYRSAVTTLRQVEQVVRQTGTRHLDPATYRGLKVKVEQAMKDLKEAEKALQKFRDKYKDVFHV